MPVSATPAVERIARILAGQQLSRNADGEEASASTAVEMEWRDHVDAARSVLRTLREPDEAMVNVGDADIWERMVAAALDEAG